MIAAVIILIYQDKSSSNSRISWALIPFCKDRTKKETRVIAGFKIRPGVKEKIFQLYQEVMKVNFMNPLSFVLLDYVPPFCLTETTATHSRFPCTMMNVILGSANALLMVWTKAQLVHPFIQIRQRQLTTLALSGLVVNQQLHGLQVYQKDRRMLSVMHHFVSQTTSKNHKSNYKFFKYTRHYFHYKLLIVLKHSYALKNVIITERHPPEQYGETITIAMKRVYFCLLKYVMFL